MEFLIEYGLFLAKAATVVVAVVIIISLGASQKHKHSADKGHLEITPLNQQFDDMSEAMLIATMDESMQKAEEKKLHKAKKKQAKLDKKAHKADAEAEEEVKSRVFVLSFVGDVSASAVSHLREEVTAVLTQATSNDEVVVKLESLGGMVHSYGLASSQLDRVRQAKIPLTVCVDEVAASGGYMMACVADKILAAPFAVIGSIGVVAQMPNFSKVLKKNDVDYEILTAGKYKRTMTMLGENTDAARKKFVAELEEVHVLFKSHVSTMRPKVDIDKIATGETWYGTQALDLALVDGIQTSDDYLVTRSKEARLFEVVFERKKKIHERLGLAAEQSADRLMLKWWARLTQNSHKQL
ncbi:MAG: protease SohB [Porticoccaceae bacterium]|nr:protease SohB [Porticoccaceae bacterium]